MSSFPTPQTQTKMTKHSPRKHQIRQTPYTNTPKQTTIICVSFKKNNTFVTISTFTQYFDFYTFNKLLTSYSCGTHNIKNANKTSLNAYNAIALKLVFFLLKTNNTKAHLILKGHKKFKYAIINTLLTATYEKKTIKILSINNIIIHPHNGCKLKKQRFL